MNEAWVTFFFFGFCMALLIGPLQRDGWKRGERGGMMCSKGPRPNPNPGSLQWQQSLCTWETRSTNWANGCPRGMSHLMSKQNSMKVFSDQDATLSFVYLMFSKWKRNSRRHKELSRVKKHTARPRLSTGADWSWTQLQLSNCPSGVHLSH